MIFDGLTIEDLNLDNKEPIEVNGKPFSNYPEEDKVLLIDYLDLPINDPTRQDGYELHKMTTVSCIIKNPLRTSELIPIFRGIEEQYIPGLRDPYGSTPTTYTKEEIKEIKRKNEIENRKYRGEILDTLNIDDYKELLTQMEELEKW